MSNHEHVFFCFVQVRGPLFTYFPKLKSSKHHTGVTTKTFVQLSIQPDYVVNFGSQDSNTDMHTFLRKLFLLNFWVLWTEKELAKIKEYQ